MRTPLDDIADSIDRLQSKRVEVEIVPKDDPQTRAAVDHMVRRSLDRQTRRAQIAEE